MELLAADVPSWLVSVAAFLFGAAWGSFFNVAIYRWPRDMSVVTPASHCPGCGASVPARFNLPLVGYLLLRGKTGCCGTVLSPRYPLVEAIGAVLCVAIAQRYIVGAPVGSGLLEAALVAGCYFAFAGGLVIATFADLERMEIPDEVTLAGAALGLATAVFRDPGGVEDAALGAGAGYLFIQVVFVWSYELLTGRRGMGEGDSKLLMMIGAFTGWRGAAFALFAGAAQGLLTFIYFRLRGQQIGPELTYTGGPEGSDAEPDTSEELDPEAAPQVDPDAEPLELSEPPPTWIGHHRLPFGPFLALGALEYLFFGDQLIGLWFDFVTRFTAF